MIPFDTALKDQGPSTSDQLLGAEGPQAHNKRTQKSVRTMSSLKGYRVIAHERRGHGRSMQTVTGNEMDTYAADVARNWSRR